MSFENSSTLKKWHMTSTNPEIDKYDTHTNGTPCEKMPKAYLPRTELSDF